MSALETVILLLIVGSAVWLFMIRPNRKQHVRLNHLPEQFIVFDLETTGLDPSRHQIIEFGAIKVNRDSTNHQTFQTLVKPTRKVSTKITEITGITNEMLADGDTIEEAYAAFMECVGDLRLVSFNADFDMSFLNAAAAAHGRVVRNPVSCALKMARRAWPGRKSYKLKDLARDGGLDTSTIHRALADARMAISVYTAAASRLQTLD